MREMWWLMKAKKTPLQERIIREMVGCQFCEKVATHSEIVVTCGEHAGEVDRLRRFAKVLYVQVREAQVMEKKPE